MRTGHCSTPFCECVQVGTLNHKVLEWLRNQTPDLYREIVNSKLTAPFDIVYLLSSLNNRKIKIVATFYIKFIKSAKSFTEK